VIPKSAFYRCQCDYHPQIRTGCKATSIAGQIHTTCCGCARGLVKRIHARRPGNASLEGIRYYIFHELAHNLLQVKAYEMAKAATYINAAHPTYDSDYELSPQFSAIEAATNTVARAIAALLGYPMIEKPPY
jgi:hypothetical protein